MTDKTINTLREIDLTDEPIKISRLKILVDYHLRKDWCMKANYTITAKGNDILFVERTDKVEQNIDDELLEEIYTPIYESYGSLASSIATFLYLAYTNIERCK